MNNKTQQPNENLSYYRKYLTLLTLFLFALSCIFSFNAFRSIIGLLTNTSGFTFELITMITSYTLPVVCFVFFFFHSFIKPNRKITKYIYSSIVMAVAIFNVIGLALNFDVFYSNNASGNYINFTSIGLAFPLDTLIINCLIVLLQAFNLYVLIRPNSKRAHIKDAFCSYGFYQLSLVEKIFVTILGIITMAFIGDFFNGLLAIKNASYDGKYIYLLMLILIIPLLNFVMFLIKPSVRNLTKKTKIILNSVSIGINAIFGLLLLIFELTTPDFVVGVGKPLFPFTFAVSIPLGLYLLVIIMVVSLIFYVINLLKVLKIKESNEQ